MRFELCNHVKASVIKTSYIQIVGVLDLDVVAVLRSGEQWVARQISEVNEDRWCWPLKLANSEVAD